MHGSEGGAGQLNAPFLPLSAIVAFKQNGSAMLLHLNFQIGVISICLSL